MLLPREELLQLAGKTDATVHFSKLFDKGVVNGYDYHLFHKMFKYFDNDIMFITTNEDRNPIYRLTFVGTKLKELFKLGNGYIKILFKNDEAYICNGTENISKLGKDVVLVEKIK